MTMKRILALLLCAAMLFSLAGCSASDYKSAAAMFESGNWQGARDTFATLGDYKDAAAKVTECDYFIALETMDAGRWDDAIAMFTALGDYQDSAAQITACKYGIASDAMAAGDYDEAIADFEALGDYEDAAEQAQACRYLKATSLMESGNLADADEIFTELGDYKDSTEQAKECRYQIAVGLYGEEKYAEALEAFLYVGETYKDTDRYTVLSMLQSDQQGFVDVFAAGMNRMFAEENIPLQLDEINPDGKGDARSFYVDSTPNVQSVVLKFAPRRADGMSFSEGQINSIMIVADTWYESTLDILYSEVLATAAVMMCVLDDSADPESIVTLVGGEISKLMDSYSEENNNPDTEFTYDGYDCSAAILFQPGEAYRICVGVSVPELVTA